MLSLFREGPCVSEVPASLVGRTDRWPQMKHFTLLPKSASLSAPDALCLVLTVGASVSGERMYVCVMKC